MCQLALLLAGNGLQVCSLCIIQSSQQDVFLFQLDPLEKEWIYSAASARVPDLSKLLTDDPSLANKKVAASSEKVLES